MSSNFTESMLVLSSTHVHSDTWNELINRSKRKNGVDDFPGYLDLYYGRRSTPGILWSGFDVEGAAPNAGFPMAGWPDLAEVRGLATGLGCALVLLHPESDRHPFLPTYER